MPIRIRVILQCCVLCAGPFVWAQSRLQIDPSSQPSVNQLAAVAHAIKECPRAMTKEEQWGKKPAEIMRWYSGPAQNVVWDVVPSSSVRSPYLGYIEFSLSSDYWVPDEVKDKFMRSDREGSAELRKIDTDVDPMKYRYEFDLGPSGLELTKMLRDRVPGSIFPSPVGKWWEYRPENTCWENAARNAQTTPQMVLPGFVAVPVGFATACSIEVSGNYFLSWCDTANDGASNAATRQACKDWLHGYYTGFYKETAANSRAVCSAKVTDDELFNAVLKYLKDHPGDRGKRTGDLIVIVLGQAFPRKQ